MWVIEVIFDFIMEVALEIWPWKDKNKAEEDR